MSPKSGTLYVLEGFGALRRPERLCKMRQKSIDATVYLIIALTKKTPWLRLTLMTLNLSQRSLRDKNKTKSASRLETLEENLALKSLLIIQI